MQRQFHHREHRGHRENAWRLFLWAKLFFLAFALQISTLSCFVSTDSRQKDEDNIREVVFRYQFDNNASISQKKANAFYLSLGDRKKRIDPSDVFMKRFVGNIPQCKKKSEYVRLIEWPKTEDMKSGKVGLVFYQSEIKWSKASNKKAEVEGGYYEAPLSSSGYVYYLKKEYGKWKVIKDVMKWIS